MAQVEGVLLERAQKLLNALDEKDEKLKRWLRQQDQEAKRTLASDLAQALKESTQPMLQEIDDSTEQDLSSSSGKPPPLASKMNSKYTTDMKQLKIGASSISAKPIATLMRYDGAEWSPSRIAANQNEALAAIRKEFELSGTPEDQVRASSACREPCC